MVENNYFFYKKVDIKTLSKKKDVLVIFTLLQETKNSYLFDEQLLFLKKVHIKTQSNKRRMFL